MRKQYEIESAYKKTNKNIPANVQNLFYTILQAAAILLLFITLTVALSLILLTKMTTIPALEIALLVGTTIVTLFVIYSVLKIVKSELKIYNPVNFSIPAITDPPTPRHVRIERLARLFIEMNYAGQNPTRDICEEMGLTSQPEWNTINRILKTAGIKSQRGYIPTTLQEALTIWNKKVRIEPDSAIIQVAPREWKRYPYG